MTSNENLIHKIFIATPDISSAHATYFSFLKACDGKRSLLEISHSLRIPLKICEKLARKSLELNYISIKSVEEPAENSNYLWAEMLGLLTKLLGSDGKNLLEKASRMTGISIGQLPMAQVSSLLIAIEMSTSEGNRGMLTPYLDDFARAYAA